MALSTKPLLRQSQTQALTMTPQMQQSLKVLQMSRTELDDFIKAEVEANPLLKRSAIPALPSSSGAAQDYSVEDFGTVQHSLQDHVAEQINLSFRDQTERKIAEELAGTLDETGYLHADLAQIAKHLHVATDMVRTVLGKCQNFEPSGLFARNLSECLALQLRAEDRLTPEMVIVLKHLDLVAKRDFSALKKLSDCDDDELAELLGELRGLNPKPGLVFDPTPVINIVPDILVSKETDDTWKVTLNERALPRVLVDEDYSRRLSHTDASKEEKQFLRNCRQKANWLTRILDQRARTILAVGSDIITRQQGFLDHGATALKPLTMKTVADSIAMHESTVSRVAGQKYMLTPLGLFELRYFFNASIKSKDADGAIASAAVRELIKQLIAQEQDNNILSDEALVHSLAEQRIVIARRTVAKYREELGIASSAHRKREKRHQIARVKNKTVS